MSNNQVATVVEKNCCGQHAACATYLCIIAVLSAFLMKQRRLDNLHEKRKIKYGQCNLGLKQIYLCYVNPQKIRGGLNSVFFTDIFARYEKKEA